MTRVAQSSSTVDNPYLFQFFVVNLTQIKKGIYVFVHMSSRKCFGT